MPTPTRSNSASSSTRAAVKTAHRTGAERSASAAARSRDIRILKREIANTVSGLRSIEGEIATVVRRMVSETLDAAITKVSNQDAVVMARDIGALALQAVQQVLRGTAEGIEEVLKSHRADAKSATRRTPARKNGSRAAAPTRARNQPAE